MCTLVILRRPGHNWPIMIGANRDEMANRPWVPPGRHWPDRPQVVAGLDQLAEGSWLGMNDTGLVAAVNNRVGSLGPEQNKHSRGELVLEALDHYTAGEASEALSYLNPNAYRPFNLLLADSQNAFWLRNIGGQSEKIDLFEVPDGLSMLTARDINDVDCGRIRRYLPRFEQSAIPLPDKEDWSGWETLLLSDVYEAREDLEDTMLIRTEHGFNTLSSSLIALPGSKNKSKPIWRFAMRYPTVGDFIDVSSM